MERNMQSVSVGKAKWAGERGVTSCGGRGRRVKEDEGRTYSLWTGPTGVTKRPVPQTCIRFTDSGASERDESGRRNGGDDRNP